MSQRTEIVCDMCSTRKGEGNHWWQGYTSDISFTVRVNFPDATSSVKDFCSVNCCVLALQDFLEAKVKEARAAEELRADQKLSEGTPILFKDSSEVTKEMNQIIERAES